MGIYEYPKSVYEYRDKVMKMNKRQLLKELKDKSQDWQWYHKTYLREACQVKKMMKEFARYFGED